MENYANEKHTDLYKIKGNNHLYIHTLQQSFIFFPLNALFSVEVL